MINYPSGNPKPVDGKTCMMLFVVNFLGDLLSKPPDGLPETTLQVMWVFIIVFCVMIIYEISNNDEE